MKLKSLIIAAILLGGTFYAPIAHANQKPVVESFTFTPTEVDVLSPNTKVDIELIVSHPSGIENISTMATLTSSRNETLSTYITRIDSPINSTLTKVTFRGSITLSRDIATGVYNLSIISVRNNLSAGYQYPTDPIESKKIRTLVGAETGLLVRSGGDLNLKYDTFVGPSYDTTVGIAYNDLVTFNSANAPIWKVGETFVPGKYYELRVPSLALAVSSSTPTVCSSDGKQLRFLSEGSCTFIVSTPKTSDYLSKVSNQTVTIGTPRIKPVLIIDKIPNQTAKDLPKLIEIFRVFSPSEGVALPQSTTPSVCIASGFFVRIVGGGTCTLTYQTKETATYLASDLYKVTFEVVRDPQTITFTPPATANLASRTVALSATASSGGAVTYATTSTGICSITGSTLNLLMRGNCAITATQAGTTTLAPISATATVMIAGSAAPSRKTITCVKGNKSKKVSGTNPKCPTGYKLKR
jgi:hypothetical protein